MHEREFSESFNVNPCSVLGLPLRNYAIGHELALIRQGNPIIAYSQEPFEELADAAKKASLASAVEICCYKRPVFTLIWAITTLRLDFNEELNTFREYRKSGSMEFQTVRQPRASNIPFHYFGAPELARLINYVSEHHALMIASHFDGSPLNFPLGLARMLYLTHLECEGSVWIENANDIETKERKEAYDKSHPESGLSIGDDAIKASAKAWNLKHPNAKVPEN